MKPYWKDNYFEVKSYFDLNDPLRTIPVIDSSIAYLFGATSIEGYASEDPKWSDDWNGYKHVKTFPTKFHFKRNEVLITPLTETWFRVELRFDFDGILWETKYETANRPNLPSLKKEFEHLFSSKGLVWPAWRWCA